MPVEQPDPTICPLCGADNRCAVERGDSIETCWCTSTPIGTQTLEAIPAGLRNRACICAQCAAKGNADSGAVSVWNHSRGKE
jgi:hypothetical protein